MKARDDALAILSLFTSTSTLLCCALPTLLVTLGFGAVVAGAVSSLPWLVTLSRHKGWVFLVAGLLLTATWILQARERRQAAACAVPAADGESACEVATRLGRRVLWVSTALWVVGFVVAFVAFPLGRALGLLG
jgi:hypothetical protein